MAFELTLPSARPEMLDKYGATIEAMGNAPQWYDSFSTAVRITPERTWAVPG